MRAENYKGGMRLEIKCGGRALLQAQSYRKLVSDLSSLLSANADTMTDAVKRLQQELVMSKEMVAKLQTEKLNQLLNEVDAQKNNIFFLEDVDPNAVRNLVNQMMEMTDTVSACFIRVEDEAYRYIIGSKSTDVTGIQTVLKEQGNAKGGGNAKMIQGTVYGSKEQIERMI